MDNNQYIIRSKDELGAAAAWLIKQAGARRVVAFDAPMGAGKTTLISEMTRLLGKAMAAVSCVCDPEVIVIGGGVARAGNIILDGVQKYFKQYAFPAAEETGFAMAELGNDAGIYGGVQMIIGG